MQTKLTFHILGGSGRARAEQAHAILLSGQHAEVYDHADELFERRLVDGVVLAGGLLADDIAALLGCMGSAEIWLPVVAVGEAPTISQVVDAIADGALDFLPLPLTACDLERLQIRLMHDSDRQVTARRQTANARRLIDKLSGRERQVLDEIASGSSNKLMARALDISPRTIEIHRANMLAKLGVTHLAQAVRLHCIAELARSAGKVSAIVVEPARFEDPFDRCLLRRVA